MVTALAAVRDDGVDECVALGGNGQVSLAPATPDGIGPPRWTVDVDFEPRVVLWDGALVWAAGSERVATRIDDYDWEALRGGGFAALDPTDGRVVVRGRFSDDLAWGNGGVAVVARARRAVRHRAPGPGVHVRHARRHAAHHQRADRRRVARHRACRGRGRSGALRLQSGRLPAARDAGRDVVSNPYSLRL